MGEEKNQDQLTDGMEKAAGNGMKRAAKMAGKKLLKSAKKSGVVAAVLPVIGFFLLIILIAALGLGAIAGLVSLFDWGKDKGMTEGDAKEILAMVDEGTIPPDDVLSTIYLNQQTFRYLLDKCNGYEKLATRTITIEAYHEYTVEVSVPVDLSEEGKEDTGGYETETETKEEIIKKTIEVSNSDTEGMCKMDWRLLYNFALFARLNNLSDDGMISKENIDTAFNQLAMKYDYAFDVVRNEKSFYTLEECQSVPHITYESGDTDDYTICYYPHSLMNSAYSGMSRLYYQVTDGQITGITEYFNKQLFDLSREAMSETFTEEIFLFDLGQLPGSSTLRERLEYYLAQPEDSNPIMYTSSFTLELGDYSIPSNAYVSGGVLPSVPDLPTLPGIIPSNPTNSGIGILPGDNGLTLTDHVIYQNPQTVGEAAVNLALSRLDWKYSQALRMQNGYWDCSSLVSRCYHELGVDIPASGSTVTLRANAELYGQKIPMDQMQAGDVFWLSNGNTNHVVMYCGNGMVVHASDTRGGTKYENMQKWLSSTRKKLYFCFRPYTGVASSWQKKEGD